MSLKYPGPVPRIATIAREFQAWLELVRQHIVKDKSGCLAEKNAAQAIPNSTDTKVEFDLVTFDPKSEYSTTDYRFTSQDGGRYQINTNIYLESLADGTLVSLGLAFNDAPAISFFNRMFVYGAGKHGTVAVSAIMELDPGDYIHAEVWHDHGAARNLTYGSFSMSRIA